MSDLEPAIAVLVGVEAPQPVTYRGERHRFRRLRGVRNDIRWYEQMLDVGVQPGSGAPVSERVKITKLLEPSETTADHIRMTLTKAVQSVPARGLFVLVLAGHGFQVHDSKGSEEEDKLDEAFATSDGELLLDDFFGGLWPQLEPTATAVIFVDTCHADGLAILGFESKPPRYWLDNGPSRIFFSASEEWEIAKERVVNGVSRGVMSLALEDSWLYVEDGRSSYESLLTNAAELTGARTGQAARTRYIGRDPGLLQRPPFSRS